MNEKKLSMLTEVVFFVGFDTVSTALSWSVMYLVAYPEIQERLHEELSKLSSANQKTPLTIITVYV